MSRGVAVACKPICRRTAMVLAGLAALFALAAPRPSLAQNPGAAACPPRPYRWQEDCSELASSDLHGLERLRYRPVGQDGGLWLTLGGEARARMDLLRDIDFGIGGQPGYVEISGRLLLHADLHSQRGARAFVQLGLAEENGRKPGPRGQDESELDVTQAFFDAPFKMGEVDAVARIGRQELDLSGNRLVTTRDGTTLRRAFEGAKLDLSVAGAKLAIVTARPVAMADDAFADRADQSERFSALSFDLPPFRGGGTLNLFLFERQREEARYLRAQGPERRYSLGAHYAAASGPWRLDAQGAWQAGRVAGAPVRAYGLAVQLDRDLGGPRSAMLGLDLVAASGDRASTRAIETFDPTYPNNGGLSDAPLFHQTNYVFAGGGVSAHWAEAIWTLGANVLVRHSTSDAVYASGRPIVADFGEDRLTSLVSQVSVRKAFGPNYEIYASFVRAAALGGLRDAGGKDAIYSRVQATARF